MTMVAELQGCGANPAKGWGTADLPQQARRCEHAHYSSRNAVLFEGYCGHARARSTRTDGVLCRFAGISARFELGLLAVLGSRYVSAARHDGVVH